MAAPGLTLQAVAELVGGRVAGAGDRLVSGVAPLDRAGPDDLSFLASARYLDEFRGSAAGGVLLAHDFAEVAAGPDGRIIVDDPARAMAIVVGHLHPADAPAAGIDPTARLGTGVVLGRDVSIGAHAVLGARVRLGDRVVIGAGSVLEDGVTIGEETVLGPRVFCGSGTRIGRRCRIKPGAVLGGIGFGYVSGREGHRRVPHVGGCLIEDDVDIGANTCIDRGSLGDTVVGAGTRIDNLVQLGHNVRVGRNCLLMAQVGVAGSTRIGDGAILAGQVGVGGHLRIGERARLAGKSGVMGDVRAGEDYGGYPARPHREWLRSQAVLYGLAPVARELQALVRERKTHG
jgi:UDP-3-O-[3-hydroxymyristoyl] glucosamine N-acyltransferase